MCLSGTESSLDILCPPKSRSTNLARSLANFLRGIMARKLALGVVFMALLAVSLAARPAADQEAGVALAGDATSRNLLQTCSGNDRVFHCNVGAGCRLPWCHWWMWWAWWDWRSCNYIVPQGVSCRPFDFCTAICEQAKQMGGGSSCHSAADWQGTWHSITLNNPWNAYQHGTMFCDPPNRSNGKK